MRFGLTENEVANYAKEIVVSNAPRDTGNLADVAIKMEQIGEGLYVIKVDQNIAPYMKYTEESWANFAYPLQGKQNPNEGWFKRSAKIVALSLANLLGGELITNKE